MVLNDSYYEITYQISFIKIRIWGKPLKKEEQHLVQSGDKKGINRLFSSDIYPARRLKIRIIKKKNWKNKQVSQICEILQTQ